MSTAINIFAKTMVRQQRIPFEVGLETPNRETLAAMQEVEDMIQNPAMGKTYDDVDEMMKELLG
jgi:DNA-damage-inducible protein J